MTYLVSINGHPYLVSSLPMEELERRVLDAVQAGGSMITIPTDEEGTMRVLVTASSAVRVGRVPDPISATYEADELDTVYLDLDL